MRPLRRQQHAGNHADREDERSQGTAQRQAAVIEWLVEKVADRRAERARENERRPEQRDPRDGRPVIGRGQHRQSGGENQRRSAISKSGIGGPIAERGSQGLRERDRRPVAIAAQ